MVYYRYSYVIDTVNKNSLEEDRNLARKESVYFIRSFEDGTIVSVSSTSERAAVTKFKLNYKVKRGQAYEIKPRGKGDWRMFKIR